MEETFGLDAEESAGDAWRFSAMVIELWTSAITTISMRCLGYTTGWPGDSRKLNTEGIRMIDEKIDANLEYFTLWMQLASNPLVGIEKPWRAGQALIAPYHQRTRANAHRLTRPNNIGDACTGETWDVAKSPG